MRIFLLPRSVLILNILLAFSIIMIRAARAATAAPGRQLAKLTASDGGFRDLFGQSVGLSGGIAVIGSPFDDENGLNAGSAYLFDALIDQELFKLTASDAIAGDCYGYSVAINGNRAIIGSPKHDDTRGSAYIVDTTTGTELFELTALDRHVGDDFGWSVSIDDNIAVVGAHYGDGQATNSGAAYLFNVTTGQQLFKLAATDGEVSEQFGWSVSISGNTAIVGANFENANRGAAYLFDVTTGQQLFKLTASDGESGDEFGRSVAIEGNLAIVGAPAADFGIVSGSGAAYIFDITTGDEVLKIGPSDALANDEFGESVSVQNALAAVGAFRGGFTNPGFAYVYNAATGAELFKLTASGAGTDDNFGNSISIDGSVVLVGAREDDDLGNGSGSAYVFAVLVGDYNRDGFVDAADYVVWRKTLGQTGTGLAADGDGNNEIGPEDYEVWRAHFGRSLEDSASSLTEAVPEPTTLILVLAALMSLIPCVLRCQQINQT